MTDHGAGDSEAPDSPEEPYLRSEPALLSPASPKPLHFPQPTNLPVLDKMMDVGFNQTQPHMNELRDTELRPGAWRDPEELKNETTDHASPFSTGGDAAPVRTDEAAVKTESAETEVGAHSSETATNGHDAESDSNHNGVSYEASHVKVEATPDVEGEPHSDLRGSTETDASATAPSAHSNNPSQSQSTPFAGDVQSLLDRLQTSIAPVAHSASADAVTNAATPSPFPAQAQPSNAGTDVASVPGPESSSSGLPPRPPPQEQPLINANYVHSQHIRDYHPHAANPAVHGHGRTGSSGNVADSQSHNYVPPVGGTPQSSTAPNNNFSQQQSPATATFNSQGQGASPQSQFPDSAYGGQAGDAAGGADSQGATAAEDRPWTAETQVKYDHFMNEERRYVNEAKWDQFPQGSRLFVGNLSSDKVTKRDIFHVFHPYGEIAQISIKQAYGFVQFLRAEDCMRAMAAEQGRQVRDKRIHLEQSKPQKPPRNQQPQQNQDRRSRSPAYDNRGRNDRNMNGRGRGREGDYRSNRRSPSPRDYRDRHQERYRTRSRSPGYGRDRYRGGSPRTSEDDDHLPLPRRRAGEVPEVQVIALDLLERDFLSWVEKAFASRGVRVDVLTISPRLSEQAVVRRQIVEGVVAICKLRRINQDTAKIGLTIFKRRPGSHDVQFEEYDNLDPDVCAQLAIRERQNTTQPASYGGYSGQYSAPSQPPQQQFGYPQPPAPSPYGVPPPAYPPNYGQPPSQYGAPTPQAYPPHPRAPAVDSNNLQSLLSSLNTSTPQGSGHNPYGTPSQHGYPPQAQSYAGQQYPPAQGHPGFVPPQQQQRPPAGSPPSQAPSGMNMQDILARLGSYNRQ